MLRSVAALIGVALLVSACGDGSDPSSSVATPSPPATPSPSDSPTPTEPSESATGQGVKITGGASEFGPMLFDSTGQAIYLFDVETSSKPECYGECSVAWPPVLTKGPPVATGDVDSALLGTVKRSDGQMQVTYNDHPLYFYAHEGKGEVRCHNVFLNGGKWYVVRPSGEAAPPG